MIREENIYTIILKGYDGEKIQFESYSTVVDNKFVRTTDSGIIEIPIFI